MPRHNAACSSGGGHSTPPSANRYSSYGIPTHNTRECVHLATAAHSDCLLCLSVRSSPDKTYTSFRRSSGAATAARAPHSLATQLIGCTMSSDGSATTGGCRDASGGHVTFVAQCVRGSTVVVAQAIAAEFADVLADYGATTLTVPPHAYAKEGPKLDNSKPSDPSMASSKKRGRRFPKVALSEHYDDALPKRKGEGTEGTYRVPLPDSCARIRLIQANQRFSLLAFTVDPCSAALKGGDGNHNWHAATREVARRMYRLRGIDDFYVLVGSWVGMGVMKGYLDQLEELVRPLPNVLFDFSFAAPAVYPCAAAQVKTQARFDHGLAVWRTVFPDASDSVTFRASADRNGWHEFRSPHIARRIGSAFFVTHRHCPVNLDHFQLEIVGFMTGDGRLDVTMKLSPADVLLGRRNRDMGEE